LASEEEPGRSGFPVEIEAGRLLKVQSAFLGIALPSHHDQWGNEFQNFKVFGKLGFIPDRAESRLKCFSATGLGIDFSQSLSPD
jgi:hypothetical protein